MRQALLLLTLSIIGHLAIGQSRQDSLPIAQPRQDSLPTDPATGLVCLTDSVKAGAHYPLARVKGIIGRWGDAIPVTRPDKYIFGVDPKKKEIKVDFYKIYKDDERPGRYVRGGQLDYREFKKNGKPDSSDKRNAAFSFNLYFEIREGYIVYEFTDLRYMGLHNELAKFEDATVLGPDGVHYLSEEEIPWIMIKQEEYGRMQILARNLKKFIRSSIQTQRK